MYVGSTIHVCIRIYTLDMYLNVVHCLNVPVIDADQGVADAESCFG